MTTADDDGQDLQENDDVDDAVAGAKARMWLAEPVAEDAVFGNAVEHAVGADDRGVDGACKDERADHNNKSMKNQADEEGALKVHGQAAD